MKIYSEWKIANIMIKLNLSWYLKCFYLNK